jgi:hypothetical protein
MSLEATGPAPEGDRPDAAATTQLNTDSLAKTVPGFVVVMVTRTGMPRRKVYVDLGHARAAVARARGQGRPAWLVLCELRPVGTDLDDGGDQ